MILIIFQYNQYIRFLSNNKMIYYLGGNLNLILYETTKVVTLLILKIILSLKKWKCEIESKYHWKLYSLNWLTFGEQICWII